MSTKTNRFIPDFFLESNYNCHSNNHHCQSECNGDSSNTNSRARNIFSALSEMYSFCYEVFYIQWSGSVLFDSEIATSVSIRFSTRFFPGILPTLFTAQSAIFSDLLCRAHKQCALRLFHIHQWCRNPMPAPSLPSVLRVRSRKATRRRIYQHRQ